MQLTSELRRIPLGMITTARTEFVGYLTSDVELSESSRRAVKLDTVAVKLDQFPSIHIPIYHVQATRLLRIASPCCWPLVQ